MEVNGLQGARTTRAPQPTHTPAGLTLVYVCVCRSWRPLVGAVMVKEIVEVCGRRAAAVL